MSPYYATGSPLVNQIQQLSCKYYRASWIPMGAMPTRDNLHDPLKYSIYMPIACRVPCRSEDKTHLLQLDQTLQLNCNAPAALHRSRANPYDESRPHKREVQYKREVQWQQRHIAQ
jgi:hypothetical protein